MYSVIGAAGDGLTLKPHSQVPFLIRVATVSAVKGHQVRVSFDGWPEGLAAWLDDDSPDLHPVGWCLKTGHPLEPPLSEYHLHPV